MKKIHVFTSAACNYLPKVRVLIESIRKFHPEWVIHLALADRLPEGVALSDELFDEIHPLESLGISNWLGWAFCHSIVELSTAIKPFLMARLLAREDCAGVIYLDPDTVLFSRLDDVVEAISHSNIALTPHLTVPGESMASVMDNEISSLKRGIYNLGFIAVAATNIGREFAQWWSERLYYFCRAEIHNGLFTDQRWIDLVPAFFEGVYILRTSRLNVAPWNISARQLSGQLPGAIMVDGQPLGFYHFTGFDSGAHNVMVHKHASEQRAVHELVRWYADTISVLAREPLSQVAWAFSRFDDGDVIPKAARLVYRERPDLQQAFGNPFSTQGGGYKAWWEGQGRVEYPRLFDEEMASEEMFLLTQALTPGYQAGASSRALSIGLVRAHLDKALGSRENSVDLVKRAWKVWRNEGVAGVMRRISR